MTTITPLSRPPSDGFYGPVLGRAVIAAIGNGILVIMAGFLALACYTMPAEHDLKLMSDLQSRILEVGKPANTCGRDGSITTSEPGNCRDMRGFRIVVDAQIRVFSLRYDKPLFVFGIENGMIFTNQKMVPALLESEKSAFFRYIRKPYD